MATTSKIVNIQGYHLHYLESGTGSPVILLHGFAGSCEEWRPTVELLGHTGYRAIAVDAMGFGKSDKSDQALYSLPLYADLYAGLLDALHLKQATFVGHSFGGKCVLATAILHPQRVHGLVVVDSEGFIPIPLFMKKAGVIPGLGEGFIWLSKNPKIFHMQLVGTFYDAKRIPKSFEDHFRTILGDRQQVRALMQLSRCYDNHDLIKTGLRKRLRELRCPTLIVWGANDRVFSVKCGHLAHREIPGSHLVVIPQCGHYPHIEAYRDFHGLLLGFLAKHDQK